MIIQEDTVFVSGLPTTAAPTEIAEFFGKIGIIKVKICIIAIISLHKKVEFLFFMGDFFLAIPECP